MNHSMAKATRNFLLTATGLLMLAGVPAGLHAQDTTTTTMRHGEKSFDTQVKNAEVVYVEGNNLVLRSEDGKIEHLIVPDSDKFTVDGKVVSVQGLTPGTKLTQTITTSTAPRYVTSIRTIKGRIWHVNPHARIVIVTLPEGGNVTYKLPEDVKFTTDGSYKKSAHDLRKGMIFEATIVTDDTHTVMEETKATVGQTPPPVIPREVGMLLFLHSATIAQPVAPVGLDDASAAPVVEPAVLTASAEEPLPESLPTTGTALPAVGLLGGLAMTFSLGLGTLRRAFFKA
jgi:hypothetical protein